MSDFTIEIERQLSQLGRDIQQFVERIVPIVEEDQDFTPDCDIVESDESFAIYLDLPGLSKKEIQITLNENVLTIKGERTEALSEDETFTRRERRYGAFARSFALPETVDTSETKAKFQNGVLTVTMSKTEEVQDSTEIPIS